MRNNLPVILHIVGGVLHLEVCRLTVCANQRFSRVILAVSIIYAENYIMSVGEICYLITDKVIGIIGIGIEQGMIVLRILTFGVAAAIGKAVAPLIRQCQIILEGDGVVFIITPIVFMVNIIITVKIGFGSVIAQAELVIRGNIIINLQADRFAVDIALPFFTGAVLEVAAVLIIIINMVAYLALASLGIQLILSGAEVAGRNINAGFVVVNFAGNNIDNTALGTAAVKRTGTAAQYLDAFDIIRIIG